MNRHFLMVAAVGLTCLLLLFGCGRTEIAESCATDSDCVAGERCAEGACFSDPADVGPDSDEEDECQTDDDCGPSQCRTEADQCLRHHCDQETFRCGTTSCDIACPPASEQVGCDCVSVGCESDVECGAFLCIESVCSPCTNDGQCGSDGSQVCDAASGECRMAPECDTDEECPPHLECSDDQVCVDRPECTLDRDCGENERCLGGHCTFAPDCTDDSECGAFSECIAGTCHIALCRGADDCADDEVCDAGACVIPAQTKECRVATEGGVIAPNQRIPLEAFAYDEDGRGIAATFRWDSTDARVAEIQGTEVVGGSTAGTTQVRAMIASGDPILCEGVIEFTNFGLVQPTGLRVVVTHEETRRAVEGAAIYVNGAADPVLTNSSGVANLERPQGPYEMTIIAEGFNYITLQNVSAHDVRIPLSVQRGTGPVGGFTGAFDLSQISSSGDISLGLAGASLAGGLIDIDLERLLGEPFVANANVPGIGAF
ncbi:MAG: hypothetical protein ACNA8W_11400, partial [Bradymonadaceae bacterium]